MVLHNFVQPDTPRAPRTPRSIDDTGKTDRYIHAFIAVRAKRADLCTCPRSVASYSDGKANRTKVSLT